MKCASCGKEDKLYNIGGVVNVCSDCKIQRYNWSKPGDKGVQKLIPIEELLIDHSYQRPEITDKALIIARKFDWSYFGAAVVMERPNGKKYVVDGQQRIAGARLRGDIHRIPCIVFSSDGKEDEARAFLSLNTLRKPVTALQKYHAAVMSGEQPARMISEWLSTNGFKIEKKCQSNNEISFVTELQKSWIRSKEVAISALLWTRTITETEHGLSADIFKAAAYLKSAKISVEDYTNKIKMLGGDTRIKQSIHSTAIEMAAKGRSEKVCAIGLINVINHKMKSGRITLQQQS